MPKMCESCGHELKEEVPTPFDPSELPHGLYRIFWLSGGSSLASVGSCNDGTRWMAPTNWIGTFKGPWTNWAGVERVELIERAR